MAAKYVKVLKNELGAVAGTSQGFSLTPPPATGLGAISPTFTASKFMLAKEETQMNMLTELKREAVVQVLSPTLFILYSFCFRFSTLHPVALTLQMLS
jgi:hypothetical protein